MGGNNVLSDNTCPRDQPEPSPPVEIAHSLTTDLSTLVNLAGRVRPPPGSRYRWLVQKDVKIVGTHPVDAGGFADIWVGEIDDRKVAVKSYRCYATADHLPTYNVRSSHPSCASCSPTTNR